MKLIADFPKPQPNAQRYISGGPVLNPEFAPLLAPTSKPLLNPTPNALNLPGNHKR